MPDLQEPDLGFWDINPLARLKVFAEDNKMPFIGAGATLLAGLIPKWAGDQAHQREKQYLERIAGSFAVTGEQVGRGLEGAIQRSMDTPMRDLARPVRQSGREATTAAKTRTGPSGEARMASIALPRIAAAVRSVQAAGNMLARAREMNIAGAISKRGDIQTGTALGSADYMRAQSYMAMQREAATEQAWAAAVRGLAQMAATIATMGAGAPIPA